MQKIRSIISIMTTLAISSGCIAFAQNMQKETPKVDAKKTIIHGGVAETRLEEVLDHLGLTLDDHTLGTLPARVSKVERGAPAYIGGIQETDLITRVEHGQETTAITLERDGKVFKATLVNDRANLSEKREEEVPPPIPKPKLIINSYRFGGGGIGDVQADVRCFDGKISATLTPNGGIPHIGGSPVAAVQLIVFTDGHCTYTAGSQTIIGRYPVPVMITPNARCGNLTGEFKLEIADITAVWPSGVDFVEINEAEFVSGNAHNYRGIFSVYGMQPPKDHLKSALILNSFQYIGGSAQSCFYSSNTSACANPIVSADHTQVFTESTYQLGAWGLDTSYNFNGRQGGGPPGLKGTDSNVPPQLQPFLSSVVGLANLFQAKYNR